MENNTQKLDINTRELRGNAFRVTKKRNITASRIRVPGGQLNVKFLPMLQEIAETYGNGTLHITSRQGFELPGIKFKDMPKVNELLQPIIEGLDINQDEPGKGYAAAGTRNIIACIGNNVCPYACYETTGLAKRIEQAVFPHDLHFKIGITGCHNDCAKVRLQDFGVIGMTEPQFDPERCISCQACVDACAKKSVKALKMVNYRPQRDEEKCIGCGVCVVECPNHAWSRSKEKYYRLTLLGRTGKKNPRLGENFIKWIDEDSIIKIILNTYDYVEEYIDPEAPIRKEHVGYIVDRTGFEEFEKWIFKDVELPEIAEVTSPMYWNGIKY